MHIQDRSHGNEAYIWMKRHILSGRTFVQMKDDIHLLFSDGL